MSSLELIDKLKQEHANFCSQREQAQINFQQLQGAIFACESLIKHHEAQSKEKEFLDVVDEVPFSGE